MRVPDVDHNWFAAADAASVTTGYKPGYVGPEDYARDVEPVARCLIEVAKDYERSAQITEAARRHRKGRKPLSADVDFIVGMARVVTDCGRKFGWRRVKEGKPEQTGFQHICNAFLHGIDPEREGELSDAAFKAARRAFSTPTKKT